MENFNNNNPEFDSSSNAIDKKNEKKKTKRIIKTYRDIATGALEGNPTSLAKMIIMEKKKRERKEKRSVNNPKNMFMVIVSVVLSILGVISITAIFIFINVKKENDLEMKKVHNIISSINYDYKKIVNIDKDDFKDVLKDGVKNSTLPIGGIKNIFLTKDGKNGYVQQIFAREFLISLDTRVPEQFIRNLRRKFSIGIVNTGVENKPFMVFETDNVDTSFLNLQTWEKSVLFDMGELFNVNRKYYTYSFESVRLFNQELRVILNDSGEVVFGYVFLNDNKILFFTDIRTLKIILERDKVIEKQ